MAYIGDVGSVTGNRIQFLRSGKALTVLDGRPVSRETLLQVIEECNQQVHCVFSKGVARLCRFAVKSIRNISLTNFPYILYARIDV